MKDEALALEIIKHYKHELEDKPASRFSHNNFRGGLLEHLFNTLNVAKEFFPFDSKLHFLALLHDLGKCRCYKWINNKEGKEIAIHETPSVDHILHTIVMIIDYGIELDDYDLNALQFHHGGWSGFKGFMDELAIKLHFCDMMAVKIEGGIKDILEERELKKD